MEATLIHEHGLIIDKETFAQLFQSSKRQMCVREVLPKNTPVHLQSCRRTLNLYRSINKETVVLARRLRSKFVNVDYHFADVRRFTPLRIEELSAAQRCALRHIITQRYNTPRMGGECLLQMDTGLGKTRVGCGLIGKIAMPTLVIVPSKHIAKQWVNEVNVSLPSVSVELYQNKKNQSPQDVDVLVAVVNTARGKEKEFYSQFGLVIMDEVHEYISTRNKNVLWLSSVCRYVLGLTATPDTGNGLLRFIEGHLGPTIYSKNIEGFEVVAKKFMVKVEVIKYIGHEDYLAPVISGAGTVCVMSTIAKIIQDPDRMDLIVTSLRRLYDNNHNVLLFAEHRDFLNNIAAAIKPHFAASDICIEEDTSILRGGATDEIIAAAGTKRIILTTYSYSRRGVSYNHLTALLLATSRRNGLEQVIGRITRYASDETIVRSIIDINDASTVLKSQLKDREAIYNSRGYPIRYSRRVAVYNSD
jgi:superfamily II DNA or RNA helicase